MSSWVSHLRIAENLLASWPGLDEVAFTFGNLAPDSGIPTGEAFRYDPPKEVTHFRRTGEGHGRIQDLVFYREYVEPLDPDDPDYSFALGYFCHLVADNLWSLRVVQAIRRDNLSDFGGDAARMWEAVKADMAESDWRYLEAHPDSLFQRVVLVSPNPHAPLSFLNQQGLHDQLDQARWEYRDHMFYSIDHSFRYINETTMSRYVADTTASLIKIERALRRGELGDYPTSIILLSAEETSMYDAPLGDITVE
jgi:hypothetical protein